MRVMYVAPRYHTNQIPIMEGWKENGHEVCFLTRLEGTIEDYGVIKPIKVPFSKLSNFFTRLYVKMHPKNDIAYDIRLIYGFPKLSELRKAILGFKPDLVILRDKTVYCIMCYLICKHHGIKAITYNQSPLYVPETELKRNWKHKLVDGLMPKRRYTPVVTNGHSKVNKVKDPNGYFVPFVGKLYCESSNRQYFTGNRINILEVGRYEARKNHFLMVDAFDRIYHEFPNARLTIVGTLDGKFQEEYYDKLVKYISDKKLTEVITLRSNLQFAKMEELYLKSDLYVLPSTNEPAAISILEAMGYSIPVICSTANGTSDYVEEGICGQVFQDGDVEGLTECMRKIVDDRDRLVHMGEEAYRICREKYQFENYYDALMKAVNA